MNWIGRSALTVLALSVAVACGGRKPAADKSEKAAQAAVEQIGVPECDDYLAKYEACLQDKVPDAARAALRQALTKTRDAWKQAAATPEGKQGLAMGCKQALDTAKETMSAYGCQW